MAQSTSTTTPRVQSEEPPVQRRTSSQPDDDVSPTCGTGGGNIATVHRRACLRRRTVAVPWAEVAAEHRRDDDGAAAIVSSAHSADDNDDDDDDDDKNGTRRQQRRRVHLADLRKELLRDVTFIRTDGTVMPPVVPAARDEGCGSTQEHHHPFCDHLLLLEHSDDAAAEGGRKTGTAAATPPTNTNDRQQEAVARHVGDALVRSLKSTSLGGGGAATGSRTRGRVVRENRTGSPKEEVDNVKNANANANTNATMSTPRKILGSLGSVAWGLAQIVSPVLATGGNTGHYEDMYDEKNMGEGEGESDKEEEEEDGTAATTGSSRHRLLDDDRDMICHVGLLVECGRLLLSHAVAATATTTELDGPDAKLLYRFERGPHSLAEFCRSAAAASASLAAGAAAATAEESADRQALCELVSGLSSADLELLLLGMVRAGCAVLSSDGDVVALLPQRGAANAEAAVDEVHLAIFRLQSTASTLERRIDHLSEQAEAAQSRAVAAQRRRQPTLAVAYLKLRNLRRTEIDRTSASLLNVEQSLQTLHRTRADAEVLRAYRLAGEAMRMARTSEEEGGWGINAETVRETADELAELTEEVNETSAILENVGTDNGVGQFSDEELMQELEALEEVDDLADVLGRTGLEEKEDAGGTEQVNQTKAADLDAESGKGEDECSRGKAAILAA
eukprot:CAMPEP_0181037242 /NCGR_PEP_ID=MMETSP1070-20121207/9296_1 /TAXON_ID=265543 /ORGANISM="Minutocellus polymorphus, Strain NH13" /LENGTH=676 /DNA_ID=CAMNT_0023114943 /DNA_START=105 /DNA_END=2135 /DNA_ORIENTATION=-